MNMKNGLRMKIRGETLDYLLKHNLFEKYFNNFTNFNSNNYSFKEGFNTYASASQTPYKSRSPIYGLENIASIGNYNLFTRR